MNEVHQLHDHRVESGGIYSVVEDLSDTGSIANNVCAFLNSETGGMVYVPLGLRLSHIEEHDGELQRYSSLCKTVRGMISPHTLYSMSVRSIDSGKFLVIDVPSGPEKPYLSNGTFWIKDDSKIRAANRSDINQLIDFSSKTIGRWERKHSLLEEEDIDFGVVEQVRRDAERSGRLNLGRNIHTPLDILRELSYWSPTGFTNASAVIFGRHPERWLPQVRSHILIVEDKKTDDEVISDWYEGSLLTIARQMHQRLLSINLTKSYFNGNSLSRTDLPKYDPFVLREALINAIVHRDYTSYGSGLAITVYRDRIEFWNSGKLNDNISVSDLPHNHQSLPNNPDIAYAFFLCNYMDRIGRGTQKIAESCRNLGVRSPEWKEDSSGVTLTIYASFTER